MPAQFRFNRGVPVPSTRFARLARFGGMAGGVAGGAVLDALRQIAGGGRPRLGTALLTPANAARIARELAHLRGAAMKVGQLMSMDAGELLPAELAETLARLRADAEHMPPRQLKAVLDRRWGRDWLRRFAHFEARPVAAASIGQVHRATAQDGRDLAIKVQYPGVRESIDSDLANVAALIRLSGALPAGVDLAPILAEARRQLAEEADYTREADCLTRFAALVADDDRFVAPVLAPEFCTDDVLAMSFLPGAPIERLSEATQAERDRVVAALLDLALRELFEFRLMQTDPNFANYRYDPGTGRIALLDFGATREIPAAVSSRFRALARAALDGDRGAVRDGMVALGLLDGDVLERHEATLMGMVDKGLAPLQAPGAFDFGDRTLARQLRDEGMDLVMGDRAFWRPPPPDVLFVQRKLGGMYLLASRLGARIDLRDLLARRL